MAWADMYGKSLPLEAQLHRLAQPQVDHHPDPKLFFPFYFV